MSGRDSAEESVARSPLPPPPHSPYAGGDASGPETRIEDIPPPSAGQLDSSKPVLRRTLTDISMAEDDSEEDEDFEYEPNTFI